jgi:uncharacterized protein YbjQ (UPF0145 family)
VIVTTTNDIPGENIAKTLGLVTANTVRARHIGRDILAGLKNLIGGEVSEYSKLLAESREEALHRVVQRAHKMGANAVVNLRFTTSMVAGGAAEILAYGTAVVIEQT